MNALRLFFADLSQTLGLQPSVLGNIVAALLLLFIGYLVAKLFSKLIRSLIDKTGLQEKLDANPRSRDVNLGKLVGKLVYYLLMVIVLIGVLELLGVESALRPLENLVNGFVAFLPRLVAAAAIAFAGYIIATLVSELAALAVGGVEGLSERFGLNDAINWANLTRQIVFFIIIVPLIIAAIDALGVEAISEPAVGVLRDILGSLPRILAAFVVLVVFYYLAKFISNFVRNLLLGLNTELFVSRMQLSRVLGNTPLSSLVGGLIFFFIIFSGVLTAVEILQFEQLVVLLHELFEITLQIIFGLVVLAIGNVIGNFAYNAVMSSQESSFLASLARVMVLGLFIAIALRTMGIADDIVNLAFGLTLGSVAVAFALSFGLGGREAAGRQMEDFFRKFRTEVRKRPGREDEPPLL